MSVYNNPFEFRMPGGRLRAMGSQQPMFGGTIDDFLNPPDNFVPTDFGGLKSITQPLGSFAEPNAQNQRSKFGLGQILRGVGNFVKENPLEVGSLALSGYGMYKQGKNEDEERERQERERRAWSDMLLPVFRSGR